MMNFPTRILLTSAAAASLCLAQSAPNNLFDAVSRDDRAAVRSLLKQKVDVNATQPDGTTALHIAAQKGDAELVALLLAGGAKPNMTTRYGVTPLTEAAASPGQGITANLLKAGADPNVVMGEGETPLMLAAHSGNADAVQALLAAGANVNVREGSAGQTALMWAAAEQHSDIVRLLVAHGADVKARSTLKTEPGRGGPPWAKGGMTALLFAARAGDRDSVKTLLDAGADINEKDGEGINALIEATINAHFDTTGLLLDRGADVNQTDDHGRAVLYAAVDMHTLDVSVWPARHETDQLASVDIVRKALEKGANPNLQLKSSVGAKAFLDKGDNSLNAGTTPFIRAAKSGDTLLMHVLLEHGANPALTLNDKTTALMVASGLGHRDQTRGTEEQALEAVKLCIEKGIDVNAVSDRGDTAMHGAAFRGANDIVRYLAANGARLDVKNKQQLTPLDVASGKNARTGFVPKESTVALLRELTEKSAVAAK